MIKPLQLEQLAEAQEQTKHITTLLADDHRKLVSIKLQKGAILAAHKAICPITIHCVEGEGELVVSDQTIPLTRGVIVPLDPHVMHEVKGKPDLALLVTMFRSKSTPPTT